MLRRSLATTAVLGILCQASLHPQTPPAPPYQLVPNWGVLPGGATWGEVPGMAIDADGRIFAFHRSEPPIVEMDANGKVLKS